ncbi:Cell-death-related nuclease 7 [Trichinella pseudospiralis]|uniref:Cell-death-related nuclease 7 n=1 Tax=Trichinella pseudospiralis TaxID=6337 RepID=A0A0V0XLL0_TRIPS|nr:Cell-death-related nuclease 7 [Trichinella pseudospiralis]
MMLPNSWIVVLAVFVQLSHQTDYLCQNENTDVDWLIAYKMPKVDSLGALYAQGLQLFTLNSKAANAWAKIATAINVRDQPLEKTLRPYYAAVNDADTLKIWYDSSTVSIPDCALSPSKGVIMGKQGNFFMMQHSVSGFPPKDAYNWPTTDEAVNNAQMVICMSLAESTLKSIVEGLQYETPLVYLKHLPDAFKVAPFTDLIEGKLPAKQTTTMATVFKTKPVTPAEQATFTLYTVKGKSKKNLFSQLLAPVMRSPLTTWTKTTQEKYCQGPFSVLPLSGKIDITSGVDVVPITREKDSSRWLITNLDSKPVWCFTNTDFTKERIPCGALCMENADVYALFKTAAATGTLTQC